ncbi:hypothetical protein KP509_13G008700 [Ceratopteris richardii]|uniref:Uncharacterized protein n=1 Tax=Ceratopteris richardii TaxID=49495 RepID=A0A8T2TGC4_CERRI|nr:hypothetical protein KP509_13G008700 [Ceratopteris richardii]
MLSDRRALYTDGVSLPHIHISLLPPFFRCLHYVFQVQQTYASTLITFCVRTESLTPTTKCFPRKLSSSNEQVNSRINIRMNSNFVTNIFSHCIFKGISFLFMSTLMMKI